jgi:hypothetical protein
MGGNQMIPFIFVLCILFLLVFFWIRKQHRPLECALKLIETPDGDVTVLKESDGSYCFSPVNGTDTAVILYPGSKVENTCYALTAHFLAKHNIACFLPHLPKNLSLLDPDRAIRIKAAHPEIHRWILCGHSMGGIAIQKCALKHPEAFCGLVILAARIKGDFSRSSIPIMQITATKDVIVTEKRIKRQKFPNPGKFRKISIEGGCHSGFSAYETKYDRGIPDISRQEQLQQIHQALIEFMKEIPS